MVYCVISPVTKYASPHATLFHSFHGILSKCRWRCEMENAANDELHNQCHNDQKSPNHVMSGAVV